MGSGRKISFIVALSMMFSAMPVMPCGYAETYIEQAYLAAEVYSCDFGQLVKDGADTAYGTAEGTVKLDEYTTAVLTYDGTYVSADGKVYIKSGTVCNKNGYYSRGSYIAFTAPSNGTITAVGADIGWFEGETYKGYGSRLTIEATAGTTYYFGYRKVSTYIDMLTFTPSGGAEATDPPSEEPPEPSGDTIVYTSPSTVWNFETAPSTGKSTPVMGGNALWADGEVQFPAADNVSGSLTVDMESAVRNNVTVEFDAIGHDKALGQQWFGYSISNSEETVVDFEVHPYDATAAKGLYIGGEQAATDAEVRGAWTAAGTTRVKTDIDYHAGKVSVTVGSKTFTGSIPEGTIKDMKKLEIFSRRNKTASPRYISVDNLKIAEFDSTEPAAPVTVTEGYGEDSAEGYLYRVKAQNGKPAVIYLASELRAGEDNVSQLYDAKPLFDRLGDSATLIAPQTDGTYMGMSRFVNAIRSKYGASSVTVVGQSQSAAAALASGADKIVTIAGAGDANTSAKVWAFAGYNDEVTPVADVRAMVSRLQKAKTSTRYTEYPFDTHKINDKSAADVADWILNDTEDSSVVDLVLFSGQSNMAGRGDYAQSIVCPPGQGYEYHSVTAPSTLSTVSEPFGKYENNSAINDNGGSGVDRRSGDMVAALMKAYYENTGVPMVGVQASRGGQNTGYFLNTTVMGEMQKRYKEAEEYLKASGYTVRKKLLVWCQGEADADAKRTDEVYKTNTLNIFSQLKAATGITDAFIVQTGHYNINYKLADGEAPSADALAKDAEYLRISNAQKALADENDNVYAVASFYSDECLAQMRDQYHYYQPVYNTVGTTAGEAIAEIYKNEIIPDPGPTPAPKKYEVTSSETSVDVSELTAYGASSYRMYRTDGTYESVKASDAKIANATGGEVTIVPEYKLNFATGGNGTGAYTADKGYGLLSGYDYHINSNGALVKDGGVIKMDIPDGYYDITVKRMGGSRTDIYSNGRIIINNTVSSSSQNRPADSATMEAPRMYVEGGNLNLTMGNTSGSNERINEITVVKVPQSALRPTVWVAGDSESANYYPIADSDLGSDTLMMTGFGMQLKYFMSDKYNIANFGQPSDTVKLWMDECGESVMYQLREGDVLLIDFGINDAASSKNKIPLDEMKSLIKELCDNAKKKGSVPVLISPVYCGKYQNKAYYTYNLSTDKNDEADFAKELGVGFIDLNKYLTLYINKAAADTGDTAWGEKNYQVMKDNLHMTQYGALLAASFIAGGLDSMGYETKDFAYTHKDAKTVGESYAVTEYSGVERVYSVAAAMEFMRQGSSSTPEPTTKPTSEPQPVKDELVYDAEFKNVSVRLSDESIEDAVMIKAAYDENGRLVKTEIYNVKAVDKVFTQPMELKENDAVLLWKSLTEMVPLTGRYVYIAPTTNS